MTWEGGQARTDLLPGLAYKAEVGDDRESPSYNLLIEKLKARAALVDYNHPNVRVSCPFREHSHLAGRRSVPITTDYDNCLIPVVDARNCGTARPEIYYQA
jgi:UDP-N-acetyl-D-glucosamine dehydrogenase